ncbi:MAG: hypothetical protein HRT44_05955, partial [Bdellovibrionales bacterium]|nr:hypothetical protein [Bdellovibrionales bacterium]NQZ18786.1 hypothetical protein [Bdellovibrionales bacterium]
MKRRDFCYNSLLGAGALTLSQWPSLALANQQDDHFYIHIVVDGGWDPSYLFDARPLKMTQDSMIQNYNGTEPTPYTGVNGGKAL